MEMIINSSYLITIGTLIGYERKMKCKELAGTKEKEAYKQIPFCEGICCVQTYRNIEKATLEVKTPIYEELLHKLGYEMNYDDALYKEINYRLQNLNDAIEKFELDSSFLIISKLKELFSRYKGNDIYITYLDKCMQIILNYYHENKLPDEEESSLMEGIYIGFPSYFKDILIDLICKYGSLNIIEDEKYYDLIKRIELKNSRFVPNKINYLQYLCNKAEYEEFYFLSKLLIQELHQRAIYLRILDIYDLKTFADLTTDPTRIELDLEECSVNVSLLFKKLNLNPESINPSEIPKQIRRKLEQHYYHMGYALLRIKDYEKALHELELSLIYDNVFEMLSKVALFNCYDRLNIKKQEFMPDVFEVHRNYDVNNKHFVFYKYFRFKYDNENCRDQLKYLKKHVIDVILPEDTMLIKILFYELNSLSKKTSNYQILQEFIEKMGFID